MYVLTNIIYLKRIGDATKVLAKDEFGGDDLPITGKITAAGLCLCSTFHIN